MLSIICFKKLFTRYGLYDKIRVNGVDTVKKVGILTLGCKVNQYESAAVAEELARRGYDISDTADKCDFYIINTCTVTSEADRKSRQMIRRLIKTNQNAKVIVMGCYAQVNAEKIAEIEGVDCIIGTRTKMEAVEAVEKLSRECETEKLNVASLCENGFEKMLLDGRFGGGTDERTRAYIKIQDGCDSNCTYCIIPSARGPVCSKSHEDVLEEIKNLAAKGFLEVVLTGIETAAYGRDFKNGYTLADLLEEADKIDGIERIRLGSLDPSLMKPEFVERISKLKKLTPHFHISLQSGCDIILAAMKRKYNTRMLLEYMENIREKIPGVMFTTDIICGFPGETDKDFADTCDLVRKAGFLSAHIFAYSKRQGTPAAEMGGQVPSKVASDRVNKLYSVVAERARELLSPLDGKIVSVIPENYKDGEAYGHTASFVEVAIRCDEEAYTKIQGKLTKVKLSVKGNTVTGELQ